MPTAAYEEFLRHIQAARHTAGTASALSAQVTGALQVDDLLRGALVQAVSALDRYVHEEVRVRVLQHFIDNCTPSAMLRFQVPLSAVLRYRDEGGVAWLDEVVRSRHSFLSFQSPDKIADAIRLVSDGELWSEVAQSVGRPAKDLKQELKLIVARRNSIAHESDISPVPPYDRNEIKSEDVAETLDFVEKLVSALHSFLNETA
ncbi:HEPN domain-containing protein [Streptomyces sp. NPDC087787]|uniref:HEPN domain-containing protein n=1 Tax=Streptomyces sp. NPDC087787 TaxID=3365803 RepID=UPI0037F469E2